MPDEDFNDIVEKYKQKLEMELNGKKGLNSVSSDSFSYSKKIRSIEYQKFRSEILPDHFSKYEKLCNLSEKILKVKPDKKKEAEYAEAIEATHLNITPTGAASLSMLVPIVFSLAGLIVSVALPYIFGKSPSFFFVFFIIIASMVLIFPLQSLPMFLANSWRLKASNEMVLSIFYIVTYMRHTSNLELAIDFAASHLSGPLALDLKKVLWDVETEKYESIKESLDSYLETWRKWNIEYIESMHLIESSLYESSEEKRVEILDKALNVILEETYEKMLHYAHNLKGPITTLHMLGIILPILGMVILPLAVNFLTDANGNPIIQWYHIAIIYNIMIPVMVFYLGKNILAKRPTGYGEVDISDQIPGLKKYKNFIFKLGKKEIIISPKILAIIIISFFMVLALMPVIIHKISPGYDIGLGAEDKSMPCLRRFCFFDYKTKDDITTGPYGLGAAIISLFFPIALGLGIGAYYKMRSDYLIKIRNNAKELEKEFASAIFQLGNRLGDGLPAEIAFGKVADVMEETTSGKFFRQVSINIKKLGFSVKDAIFNLRFGAIAMFPSKIIESTMKVLVESVEKGPKVAAKSLINISRYIKEIHRVEERLKDLLSDIISSMKSQISMLAPAIAGIIIGLTSMITNILGKIGPALQNKAGESSEMSSLPQMFGNGIPTYYFQIVVGLYVVEIIYILTVLSNGIENGSDKLNEEYLLGKNMIRSTLLYVGIAMVVMVVFNVISSIVLKSVLTQQ